MESELTKTRESQVGHDRTAVLDRRRMLRTLIVAAGCGFAGISTARAEDAPDPVLILEGARLAATLTKLDEGLTGSLMKGRLTVPVALFLKGEEIQFQFNPDGRNWEVFHMRLKDDSYRLFEIENGRTTEFPAKRLVEPIASTDLTYEDLALRFFYWPNPKYEGTERIGGHDCYRLRLDKPANQTGRYTAVYVWVHKKFGAFMQIRGHNPNGGLIKEFQVQDVMQVADGVWTLRKMQVSTHDPSNGRRISITNVVFDEPKKVRPRGLR